MDSPEVSVVEPQLAPSRISVVLVEEAKVGGTHRLQCPRVGWSGETGQCDTHVLPGVEGTLSSPDLAGKLFPVVEVMDSPEVSVVKPQSVPSRMSMVLIEEAKVGGTHGLQCPRVDQDLRLLAGVAKPASVTVCEDSHASPGVEGTLSSPDLAGKVFPVVPAGLLLPVGPVGPVGLYGIKAPSDLEPVSPDGPYFGPVGSFGTFFPDPAGPIGPHVAGGPVGPLGTLSPLISNPAGPVGLYVAGGPVGPFGMLSTLDSDPAGPVGQYVAGGPVGPHGTLSSFISDPAGPVGPYVAGGPVGPYGTLSPLDPDPDGPVGLYVAGDPVDPCDSDYVGPVGLCGTLSPSASELAILVDPAQSV